MEAVLSSCVTESRALQFPHTGTAKKSTRHSRSSLQQNPMVNPLCIRPFARSLASGAAENSSPTWNSRLPDSTCSTSSSTSHDCHESRSKHSNRQESTRCFARTNCPRQQLRQSTVKLLHKKKPGRRKRIPSPSSQLSPSALEIGRNLEAQLTSQDDNSIPHTIPSFSVDGYSEWHHTSHLPEPFPALTEDEETDGDPLLPKEASVETADLPGPETRLLSVPVLTKEEQLELAATPAHPAALTALYGTYVACCLGEKVWRFGLPAILSLFLSSMQPIAVLSFSSQLVIFLGAPWVGQFMDQTPRVTAFNTLCIVQTVAMLVSALATVYGLRFPPLSSVPGASLLTQPWFLVVMVAGAVDKLTGLASGVAFERDWVILLAGQNRPIALASANAILRRVDLFCELAGPMSFGWLLSNCQPLLCLHTAVALSLVSLPVLLVLVRITDRLSSGALRRPRHTPTATGTGTETVKAQTELEQNLESKGTGPIKTGGAPPGGPLSAALQGWRSFLGQSVLPASLAYVLLYFNAVLSPGGLMTSFLTQRGVDVSVIGAFRGACAAMGFAATFVSAPLVARLGVLKAGASALLFQSALLAASVAVFFCTKDNQKGLLMLFLGLVVLSRLGHWLYDVIDAQIFQTAVPSSEANLVGTTEIALASLAELGMLGVAIVLHDVSSFGQLALLSAGAVLAATAIYCVWLARPDEKRSAMFPQRPEWAFGRDEEEEGERTGVLEGPTVTVA